MSKTLEKATSAPNGYRRLASPLLAKLISAAEAEEKIFRLLADAVNSGDRAEVFRLASELTAKPAMNQTAVLPPKERKN